MLQNVVLVELEGIWWAKASMSAKNSSLGKEFFFINNKKNGLILAAIRQTILSYLEGENMRASESLESTFFYVKNDGYQVLSFWVT